MLGQTELTSKKAFLNPLFNDIVYVFLIRILIKNVILKNDCSYQTDLIQFIIKRITTNRKPRRWRSRLGRSPRKREIGCSNPSRDISKSLKQVMTSPLPNAQ